MTNTTPTKPKGILFEPQWTLKGPEDNMVFQHDQWIDDTFLEAIKDRRTDSAHTRSGDFELAAEIPTAVTDKWAREGFDIYRESWKNIRAKLMKEDLGAFIATAKAL